MLQAYHRRMTMHAVLVFVSPRQRKCWARCYHPTVMTLNITASQRVEGVFGALKKGRSVCRRSSLVRVRVELEKRIEEFSLASHL